MLFLKFDYKAEKRFRGAFSRSFESYTEPVRFGRRFTPGAPAASAAPAAPAELAAALAAGSGQPWKAGRGKGIGCIREEERFRDIELHNISFLGRLLLDCLGMGFRMAGQAPLMVKNTFLELDDGARRGLGYLDRPSGWMVRCEARYEEGVGSRHIFSCPPHW